MVVDLSVFLIQVSGDESTHDETKSEWWWQEPIEEEIYINYGWKREIWESIKEGDKVLVYCTGDVEPYPKQLSHVFTVKKVELSDEKAVLSLGEKRELTPGVPLDLIREKIDSKELSEKMKGCGTQGFNIKKIEDSDIDAVLKWTESSRELDEGIEVSKESDLQRYFTSHPNKIEEGLQNIDPQDVLPEGAGIPDLVCKDREGKYVAIELKAGEASYDALGQIVSYMGAIRKKTGGNVRGIIVAATIDSKIRFGSEILAFEGIKMLKFKKYSLRFDVEEV